MADNDAHDCLKSIVAAAGLALAGAAVAAAPAPTAPPAAGVTVDAPAGNAAAPMAAPKLADPTLAADGSQLVKPIAHVGQPTDGYFGIQPQVTENGETAHWFHDSILFPLITVISLFVLGLLIYVHDPLPRGAEPDAVEDQPQHRHRDHLDARPGADPGGDRGAVDPACWRRNTPPAQGRGDAEGDRQPVVLDL